MSTEAAHDVPVHRERIRSIAFELRGVLAEHLNTAPVFAVRNGSAPPALVAILDVVRAF